MLSWADPGNIPETKTGLTLFLNSVHSGENLSKIVSNHDYYASIFKNCRQNQVTRNAVIKYHT
jgi:hypothetical protein